MIEHSQRQSVILRFYFSKWRHFRIEHMHTLFVSLGALSKNSLPFFEVFQTQLLWKNASYCVFLAIVTDNLLLLLFLLRSVCNHQFTGFLRRREKKFSCMFKTSCLWHQCLLNYEMRSQKVDMHGAFELIIASE